MRASLYSRSVLIAIAARVILPSLAFLPLFWPFLAIAVALLVGAALLPLRANCFGIGGKGQMYAGELGSAIAGLYLVGLPGGTCRLPWPVGRGEGWRGARCIHCALLVWNFLRRQARERSLALYLVAYQPLSDFLRPQLATPSLAFSFA